MAHIVAVQWVMVAVLFGQRSQNVSSATHHHPLLRLRTRECIHFLLLTILTQFLSTGTIQICTVCYFQTSEGHELLSSGV